MNKHIIFGVISENKKITNQYKNGSPTIQHMFCLWQNYRQQSLKHTILEWMFKL